MASEKSGEGVAGTQTLQRAVQILRIVGETAEGGWHPRDVARRTGVSFATTERLMRALHHERLVERVGPDRLYRIGPEILTLAAVRLGSFSLVEHYRPAMARIADLTQDTVFLWVRSGDDCVCLERIEGSFPIRILPGELGNRRPLGAGAAALAILAALPDEDVAGVIARNIERYRALDLSADQIEGLVQRTRAAGYGLNDGLTVAEISAVALEVPDPSGAFLAAIGIGALSSRLTAERQVQVVEWAAREISALQASGRDAGQRRP